MAIHLIPLLYSSESSPGEFGGDRVLRATQDSQAQVLSAACQIDDWSRPPPSIAWMNFLASPTTVQVSHCQSCAHTSFGTYVLVTAFNPMRDISWDGKWLPLILMQS